MSSAKRTTKASPTEARRAARRGLAHLVAGLVASEKVTAEVERSFETASERRAFWAEVRRVARLIDAGEARRVARGFAAVRGAR